VRRQPCATCNGEQTWSQRTSTKAAAAGMSGRHSKNSSQQQAKRHAGRAKRERAPRLLEATTQPGHQASQRRQQATPITLRTMHCINRGASSMIPPARHTVNSARQPRAAAAPCAAALPVCRVRPPPLLPVRLGAMPAAACGHWCSQGSAAAQHTQPPTRSQQLPPRTHIHHSTGQQLHPHQRAHQKAAAHSSTHASAGGHYPASSRVQRRRRWVGASWRLEGASGSASSRWRRRRTHRARLTQRQAGWQGGQGSCSTAGRAALHATG